KKKDQEVTEHLNRLWHLLPKADPDRVLKPMTVIQQSVVYQDCLISDGDEVEGDLDYLDIFEMMDTSMVQ
ncbi:hypothetical protein BVY03_05790, partial [bacterium K02(2017)]